MKRKASRALIFAASAIALIAVGRSIAQSSYVAQPVPGTGATGTPAVVYDVPAEQGSRSFLPADEGGKWVVVESRQVGGASTIGGTIVPVQEITFTAQLPGTVEAIAGAEGDFFAKGSVLASLDRDALLAQRQAAIAQIQNAEAAFRNAGMQYQRERIDPTPKQSGNMMSQMMPMSMPFFGGDDDDDGIHRDATLFSHETQVDQARGQIMTAQSRLREIDAKLKDVSSVAPFDGYITSKHVNQGDTVQPGQPLLAFADMSHLQVQVDVPTRLSGSLTPGYMTQARLDDPSQTVVYARVAQVFPMADATRHTVRVKFDLQPGAPAKAGMYAEVLVPQSHGQLGSAPMIPVTALVYRQGLPYVLVEGANGEPRLNLLRLGERIGEEVTVLTGLRGGERVLRNPK